jgi:hypothetical protein
MRTASPHCLISLNFISPKKQNLLKNILTNLEATKFSNVNKHVLSKPYVILKIQTCHILSQAQQIGICLPRKAVSSVRQPTYSAYSFFVTNLRRVRKFEKSDCYLHVRLPVRPHGTRLPLHRFREILRLGLYDNRFWKFKFGYNITEKTGTVQELTYTYDYY